MTVSGSVGSLSVTGSFMTGGKLSASKADLKGGFLVAGTQLTVSAGSLDGTFSLTGDGTSLSIGKTLSVSKKSLLALTGGCSFNVQKGALVKQSAAFDVVSGAPKTNHPTISNDGQFGVSAALSITGVPVSGSGSFSVAKSGHLSFNNVDFTGSSIANDGSVSATVGDFVVKSVSGAGQFSGNPKTFKSDSFTAGSLTVQSGDFSLSTSNITSVSLAAGSFLTNDSTLGSVDFQGGLIGALSKTNGGKLSADKITLSTDHSQTISYLDVFVDALVFSCGPVKCQFFVDHSTISTK